MKVRKPPRTGGKTDKKDFIRAAYTRPEKVPIFTNQMEKFNHNLPEGAAQKLLSH